MIALQSSDVRPGAGGFALPHHPQPWLQHLTHGVDPGSQGGVDQVGVALRRADLGVAQEAAIISREAPPETSSEAKVCRRSWMRTSGIWATFCIFGQKHFSDRFQGDSAWAGTGIKRSSHAENFRRFGRRGSLGNSRPPHLPPACRRRTFSQTCIHAMPFFGGQPLPHRLFTCPAITAK